MNRFSDSELYWYLYGTLLCSTTRTNCPNKSFFCFTTCNWSSNTHIVVFTSLRVEAPVYQSREAGVICLSKYSIIILKLLTPNCFGGHEKYLEDMEKYLMCSGTSCTQKNGLGGQGIYFLEDRGKCLMCSGTNCTQKNGLGGREKYFEDRAIICCVLVGICT